MDKKTLSHPIVIDEVQKIPKLLDEIHWLVENTDAYFILCGSSARKLKRGAANLLGGRAGSYHFYPLVYPEIKDFDLLRALNRGLVPSHYLSLNPSKSLKAYVNDYLKEEIQAEGLTRNLPAFARFLDSLAFSHGELTNFSNIARDCGVDSKTVKEYYQILIDTLLGTFIYPYRKSRGRETITSTPKFYLFDVGVANSLARRTLPLLRGDEAGKAFEQYILMEIIAYKGLNEKDFDIAFWRTKTGLEVDFVLGKAEIAIEVKITNHVHKTDSRGLIAFKEEHKSAKAYVVSLDSKPRKIILENEQELEVLPYENFLKMLWGGKII
jgi:predicted AAA+ superfamily ATPase